MKRVFMEFTPLDISTNLDASPWNDLPPDQIIHGQLTRIGLLPDGTVNGRATVALAALTDDGKTVIVETTWALFNTAAQAFAASPVARNEPT